MREITDTTPVVTGSGLVTALGFGVAESFGELVAGRSGIRPLEDASPESGCSLAALVPPPYFRVEPPDELRTQVKFLNGAGELAAQAGFEAYGGSGWAGSEVPAEECGLWLSQMDAWDWSCPCFRDAIREATEDFAGPLVAEALNRSSTRRVKPFFLLDSLKNNAFSFLARWWSLTGANSSVSGFAGGTLALFDCAARAVVRGDQVRALVVAAARAANGVARRDFVDHGLSRPDAEPACRPLDARGTGGVPGEAAAALALERLESARARGAEPLGAVVGYGAASGAPLDDLPSPRAETLRDAARRALMKAGIEAGDLLGVVVPAWGLPETDAPMLEAVAALPATEGAPVVSWRGATGHCALASELAEVVLSLEALRAGRLPGTAGLRDPLPAARRDLPRDATEGDGRAVLVLSAGLQGEAYAVVVAAVGPA
jgi:3-oxoacyl-[acyl-carrier-protein] synthase II